MVKGRRYAIIGTIGLLCGVALYFVFNLLK